LILANSIQIFGRGGLQAHIFYMIWSFLATSALLQTISSQLLVMKRYEQEVCSLNTPCAVTYKFVNPSQKYFSAFPCKIFNSSRSLRVESFIDYTFYQSFFTADRTLLPQIDQGKPLELGRLDMKEFRFDLFPQKVGQFQDLPAKTIYSVADEEKQHTTWSNVYGKLSIEETVPIKCFVKKQQMANFSLKSRLSFFFAACGMNVLMPTLRYSQLKRRLRAK